MNQNQNDDDKSQAGKRWLQCRSKWQCLKEKKRIRTSEQENAPWIGGFFFLSFWWSKLDWQQHCEIPKQLAASTKERKTQFLVPREKDELEKEVMVTGRLEIEGEGRKKTNSNSKIKRKNRWKTKESRQRQRQRWGRDGRGEDTRDRKREMHEDKEDDEIAKRKKGQKGKNQKKEEKKKVLNSVVKNYAPIPASSRRHLISVLWAGLQKSE